MTAAHQDIAIVSLLEEFGPEGYGIYWLLLEHFSAVLEKEMTSVPPLAHSVVGWSKICHCSARTFRKFADRAADLQLISSTSLADLRQFSGRSPADRLQIEVPKLMKYRDEWSKRSVVTTEQISIDTHTEEKHKQNGAAAPENGTVLNPPRWKSDPDFKIFIDTANRGWGDLIDHDFEECYSSWRVLDQEQRLACIKGIGARIEIGMNFQYVTRPAKFLKQREFYRPTKSPPNLNGDHVLSKSERDALAAQKAFDEGMAERAAKNAKNVPPNH